MSESAAAQQQDPTELQEASAANQDGDEEVKGDADGEDMGDGQEEEEEEEEDGDETFINNHDLIGVKGIIEHQRNEIEKKKVSAQIQD